MSSAVRVSEEGGAIHRSSSSLAASPVSAHLMHGSSSLDKEEVVLEWCNIEVRCEDVEAMGDVATLDAPRRSSSAATARHERQRTFSSIGGDEMTEHWRSTKIFRRVEEQRRVVNTGDRAGDRLFLSHCWRDPKTQVKKRMIAAYLSTPQREGGPGLSYWADWLDLQAEDAAPWRPEIEESIASCSKFVAFVDAAWLTTYTCMQELALALKYNKPVVVLVLDQLGWELLVEDVEEGAARARVAADIHFEESPERAVVAWQQLPALSTWDSERKAWWVGGQTAGGFDYCGEEVIPGRPVSAEMVDDLFARLRAMDLCPCREVELEAHGAPGLLHTAVKYVEKDLDHYADHAQLAAMAAEWDSGGRPSSLLLPAGDASDWARWLDVAGGAGKEPPPSRLQMEYVGASRAMARRRKVGGRMAAFSLALVLLVAAVVGITLAVRFGMQVASARSAEAAAMIAVQESDARSEAALRAASAASAESATAFAEAEAARAARDISEQQMKEAVGLSALSLLGVGTGRQVAELWEFKLLDAVMGRFSGMALQTVEAAAVGAARDLLSRPFGPRAVVSGYVTGGVDSIAWAPSGRAFASGSGYGGGAVVVWALRPDGVVDTAAAQVVQAHSNGVTALAWSPDGTLLASGGLDGAVALWSVDASSGRIVSDVSEKRLIGHEQRVSSLSWAPSGAYLASASWDGSVRLWKPNATNGSEAKAAWKGDGSAGTEIHALAWSPDGRTIALGGADGTVRLLRHSRDSDDVLEDVAVLGGHTDEVRCLAWAPTSNGYTLASGSLDDSIRIWDIRPQNRRSSDGTVVARSVALTGHSRGVTALSWSPSARYLASGSWDDTVRVWITTTPGAYSAPLALHPVPAQVLPGRAGGVWSLAWAPAAAGGYLASSSGSEDFTIRLWSVPMDAPSSVSPKVVGPVQSLPTTANHTSGALAMTAFAPTGRCLATVAYGESSIHLRRISADGSIDLDGRNSVSLLAGSMAPVSAIAWSPSGSILASSTDDGSVRMWYVAANGSAPSSSMPALEYSGPPMWAESLCWSPSGSHLLVAGWDDTLRMLHATTTGAQRLAPPVLWTPQPHDSEWLAYLPENEVVWSLSGSHLAVRQGSELRGWSVGSNMSTEGFVRQVKYVAGMSMAARSPSGTYLAVTGGVTRLAAGPDVVAIIKLRRGVTTQDDTVDFANEAWESIQLLDEHTAQVTALAWQPLAEELRLASCSVDGSIMLWGRDGGGSFTRLRKLYVYEGGVSSLGWHPLGGLLASGSADGIVRVWPIGTQLSGTASPMLLNGHTGAVLTVAWSPNGEYLGSGGVDNTVRLWERQREPAVQVRRGDAEIVSIAWSPSGKGMASLEGTGAVKLWGVTSGGSLTVAFGELHTKADNTDDSQRRHDGVAWSPDGTQVALPQSVSTSIALFHLDSDDRGGWRTTASPRVLMGHAATVRAVAWDPSSSLLASGSDDTTVRIWTVAPKSNDVVVSSVLEGHTRAVRALAWAPSRDFLASAADDHTVRLWTVLSRGEVDGTAVQILRTENARFSSFGLSWSPDGRFLATGGGIAGQARVWRDLRVKEMRPYLARLLLGQNLSITDADLVRRGIPSSLVTFPEVLKLQQEEG